MKLHRTEYLAHLLGEHSDREFFSELFGPLPSVPSEWKAQGASDAEISLDAFDFDCVEVRWLGHTGIRGPYTPRVELDTPNERIEIDTLGRRTRLIKSSASIALPMDSPVSTMDDWRKVSSWLSDIPDRLTAEMCEQASKCRDAGVLIGTQMMGGFDLPRQLMGDEEACLAFADTPEMIASMLEASANLVCSVLERMDCPLDFLHVHEDLAGKSGPLIGPTMFREFVKPYYQRVWNLAQERGAQIFSVDCDGNINSLVDSFLDAGINQLYPIEPGSGMDMVALRKKYGRRIICKGGIDKYVLRKNPEAIRAELEYKLCPVMRGGGTVFGIDHRIPNGVSIENYRYFVRTVREMLGKPPYENCPTAAWSRMAF